MTLVLMKGWRGWRSMLGFAARRVDHASEAVITEQLLHERAIGHAADGLPIDTHCHVEAELVMFSTPQQRRHEPAKPA